MPIPPQDIRIESQRLVMTPFRASDAQDAFGCISLSLTRFMAWEPAPDPASFAEVWREWLAQMSTGTDYVFTIRQRDGDEFLGLVGLHRATDDTPELGIWIRENRHGAGFGREAVAAVAQWGADILNIGRYIYPVAVANTSSQRIAESLGGVVVDRRNTPKFTSVVYEIRCGGHAGT
jgi:RimJ/RimL family protein N-acetyltransferase